jgi:hypothetical protein
VRFSPLAEPIKKQLKEQRIKLHPAKIDYFQKVANAITLLTVHGLLTEAETKRARSRLLAEIGESND